VHTLTIRTTVSTFGLKDQGTIRNLRQRRG
jgi:hypothetical protein